MARYKDTNWTLPEKLVSWEQVYTAVLMDLRDELKLIRCAIQSMNAILNCPNFMAVPRKLDRISRNTAKPKKTPSSKEAA